MFRCTRQVTTDVELIEIIEIRALEKTSFLMTLQGLRPAAVAPSRYNAVFPDRDFPVIQGNRMRPRPQRGQGWRKGGLQISEKGFTQSRNPVQ